MDRAASLSRCSGARHVAAGSEVAEGAGIGALIGGLGGLLVGLGALAIPGVVRSSRPVRSWLRSQAPVGRSDCGMVGALVDPGYPRREAEIYARCAARLYMVACRRPKAGWTRPS